MPSKKAIIRAVLAVALLLLGTAVTGIPAEPVGLWAETEVITERVSVASDGTQGDGGSDDPSASANGRYVAFQSLSDNLVSADTNYCKDVFVHDCETGQTTRVSVASDGTQGNDDSEFPSISADGRYVAFASAASNLVSGDTNGTWDVFVHDRETGQTTRVSVASDGTQGKDLSYYFPSISADGRYVAFVSWASNLVSGDTNGTPDVFVHDRETGQTTRVSVASDGAQGNRESCTHPSISADGRYVAFDSLASNLVSSDTNGDWDVFVHDRETGQTTRVSIASNGTQGNGYSLWPFISADGRDVVFQSSASNLVTGDTNDCDDVFVHDCETEQTTRVSVASDGMQGDGSSSFSPISADGRCVTFMSRASNLVSSDTNGDWDVFVHDRETGQTTRVSIASNGTQGNGMSRNPSISADGRYVAFGSEASNLVSSDTNGCRDVFVHDREATPAPTSTPTHTPTNTPTHTPTATNTPTGTPTNTPTPTSTFAPAPMPYGVTINDGALSSDSTEVTLTLMAPAGTTEMMISNDGGFVGAQWEPYATHKEWQITQYGAYVIPRTVYAKYKDAEGVISSVYQDDIVLDVSEPTKPIGGIIVPIAKLELLRVNLSDLPVAVVAALREDWRLAISAMIVLVSLGTSIWKTWRNRRH